LIPDPDTIIEAFYEEFELLCDLARQVDALPPALMENTPPAPSQKRLNLNTATAAELADLPGVGRNLAQRIIDYRTEYGEITAVATLTDIPGIGPKKLQLFADLVTV
jgi:competence ComEA-like helix-hairpin-helix protein